MTYTPDERLKKLLALAKEDADCAACLDDVAYAQMLLDGYLEDRPLEEKLVCNALPTTLQVYYGRVLELVCREMRFIEEECDNPFPRGEGVPPERSEEKRGG